MHNIPYTKGVKWSVNEFTFAFLNPWGLQRAQVDKQGLLDVVLDVVFGEFGRVLKINE